MLRLSDTILPAVVTSLLIGCSSSPTAPVEPFAGQPIVSTRAFADAPDPPTGVDIRMSCQQSGGEAPTGHSEPSETCPVIEWGGYTYWVFTDGSNASEMTVVAYDSNGNDVWSYTRPGARYLWKIVITGGNVILFGQSDRTITMFVDDLKF